MTGSLLTRAKSRHHFDLHGHSSMANIDNPPALSLSIITFPIVAAHGVARPRCRVLVTS